MMETSPTPSSPERGSLGAGDLASKYTRLASEYSKVRAQLGVLKKAVIEEKNSKEKMTETLKENDTKMRKLEAEMDALNFRNGQLMHRVEFLQQESETVSPFVMLLFGLKGLNQLWIFFSAKVTKKDQQ